MKGFLKFWGCISIMSGSFGNAVAWTYILLGIFLIIFTYCLPIDNTKDLTFWQFLLSFRDTDDDKSNKKDKK